MGHRKDSEPYIRFAIDIDGINLPLNFVRDRGKNSRTFRMIPYHKAMGITRKKMQQTVSEEILEQFRLENLEILRNWAKDLPTRGE